MRAETVEATSCRFPAGDISLIDSPLGAQPFVIQYGRTTYEK